MEIRSTCPVALVGAGTMGVGIAQVAATAGHPVLVLDTSGDPLGRGRSTLAAVRRSRPVRAPRNEIAGSATTAGKATSARDHLCCKEI